MDSYIREGKVEAALNPGGTNRITDLDNIPTDKAGVVQIYVKEYKPWGTKWTKKSFFKDISVDKQLKSSKRVINNIVEKSGNKIDSHLNINGYRVEIIGFLNQDGSLRTWYPIKGSTK